MPVEPSNEAQEGWRAFVLSPIGGEFDEIYQQLVRPALTQAGFTVSRADELDLQNIMTAVMNGIGRAHLVVAEITERNANVMYELGVAHALNKPVVILTQDINQVPFDLRSYRVVTYSPHFAEVGALIETLKTIAESVKQGTLVYSSPVTDFLKPGEAVESAEGGSPEEDDADDPGPGLLDHLDRHLELSAELNEGTTEFTEAMQEVGVRITARTEELHAAGSPSRPGHTARVLTIMRGAGKDVAEFTQAARSFDNLLGVVVPQLAESLLGVTSMATIADDDDRAGAETMLAQTHNLRSIISESLESLRGFRDSIDEVRNQKLSRDFSKAAGAAVRIMDSIGQRLSAFEADLARGAAVLEQRLGHAETRAHGNGT